MRAPGHAARAGHDRWLVSYADFITLLFVFFTALYAISTVDTQKLAPAALSLQHAFGHAGGAPPVGAGPALVPRVSVIPTAPALADVRATLALELRGALEAGRVEMIDDARGLMLSLPESATFPTGQAEVTPAARELITAVGTTLRPLHHAIRVEGHSDDVPIRTNRYISNWELSTARASAVVALLIEATGIAPRRLSAAGYAEYHPRVPNVTAADRARNRRVDIIVLDTTDRPEPATAGGHR